MVVWMSRFDLIETSLLTAFDFSVDFIHASDR
jgi:hypothetical protein